MPAVSSTQGQAPKTAADFAGTPPGTVMPPAYVELVARMAYFWGWPLVNNLNRSMALKDLPEPGRIGGIVPASPPGYVSMLTDYIDAAQRFVTCPNQDTVYGAGYQRLDAKPVVVQVPDFGDRFFTYQICDARTDAFAQIGKQYGAAADPKLKATLAQHAAKAEQELIAPLFHFHNNGRPVGNGWTSPPNGARWGTDYLSRTATAKSNMYDNAPEETRYIYTDFDSDGKRLNGANRYTVTFAKGKLPPVNGFWSLTLYNKEHLFEPNALDRFSLGTKSKSLKYSDDGSLTLYFQQASPGADKESNWVPAPKDDFSLYIRAYWPKAEILEEKWMPPQVTRLSS